MTYKEVTHENRFTQRFYTNEAPLEEARCMAQWNRAAKFPSANYRSATYRQQIHSGPI